MPTFGIPLHINGKDVFELGYFFFKKGEKSTIPHCSALWAADVLQCLFFFFLFFLSFISLFFVTPAVSVCFFFF